MPASSISSTTRWAISRSGLGSTTKATGAGDHVALPDQRTFSPLMPGYRSLLADMLGLRFIATGVPTEQIDPKLKPGDLRQIARTADAYVYENPRALPRAPAGHARRRRSISTAILATGQWPQNFDPRQTVLLDRDVAADPRRARRAPAPSRSATTAPRR